MKKSLNPNAVCEVKQNGKWVRMSVTEAKALGERARYPQNNCHGRVRLHPYAGRKHPAHYEHFPKFTSCRNCYRFDGRIRKNPDALK